MKVFNNQPSASMKKVVIYVLLSAFNGVLFSEQDVSNLFLQPGAQYIPFGNRSSLCYFCKEDSRDGENCYHAQIQGLFFSQDATESFDCSGVCQPLAMLVFGGPLHFSDIYLAASIAGQGLLSLGVPIFGNDPTQQYLHCLASVIPQMELEVKETGINFSGMCYYRIPRCNKLIAGFGFLLPIKQQTHEMTIDFINSPDADRDINGINCGVITGQDDNIKQFFSDYLDLYDFFARAIVTPKGLAFQKKQQKTDFGDLSLCAVVDARDFVECFDALQFGFNAVFPTADKPSSCKVWPLEFGNGGAFQLESFINIYGATCYDFLNPILFAGIRISFTFSESLRVPQQKNNTSTIFMPVRFQSFTIAPFAQFDSSVPYFADQAIKVKTDIGTTFSFRIGNFFNNILGCFRLGVFYDFYHKKADQVTPCVASGTFNTEVSTLHTRKTAESVLWNIAYESDDFEVYVGAQHVVSGTNIPRFNKIFASLALFY